jgi:hypothetical protein
MKIKQEGAVLKIGIILPSDTSYPIGKSFLKGLKEKLKHSTVDYTVELIKKFTKDRIEEALVKCFDFEEVDLVVGVISALQMEEVDRIAAKYQKPVFACHIGEHIPQIAPVLQYVTPISLDIWKDIYALGYYASQNFGSTAVLCESFYEAGFGFGAVFDLGMKAFDPESQLYFRIIPQGREKDNVAYIDMLADLGDEQIDFVAALFHGEEAQMFASVYQNANVSNLPLVGLPFFKESINSWENHSANSPKTGAFFSLEVLGQSTVAGIYETFGEMVAIQIENIGKEQNLGEDVTDDITYTATLTCEQRDQSFHMEQMKLTVSSAGGENVDQLIRQAFENQISAGWTNSYLVY